MLKRWTLLAVGIVFVAALPVQAQDSPVGRLYSRGLQAYFSGNFVQAHELLTAAIEGQRGDPRAYYFRGLVSLKLNRPEDAQMDFEKGAALEASDVNVFYDVSKSLERIQGRPRLAIEQYRAKARLNATKRAKALRRARYESLRSEEHRVLQKDVVLTPEPTTGQQKSAVAETTAAEAQPALENPFADTPATTVPADDPFGDTSTPKPTVEVDPFATGSSPATKAKQKAPAKSTAPSVEDDPFGAAAIPSKAPGQSPLALPALDQTKRPGGAKAQGAKAGRPAAKAAKAPAKTTLPLLDDNPFLKDGPTTPTKTQKQTQKQKPPATKTEPEDDPFAQ